MLLDRYFFMWKLSLNVQHVSRERRNDDVIRNLHVKYTLRIATCYVSYIAFEIGL